MSAVSALPGHWHNGPAAVFAVALTSVVAALAVTAGVLVTALREPGTPVPAAAGTGAEGRPDVAPVSPGLVDVAARVSDGYTLLGTGMVLTPTGRVLTNNHVIKGATAITVTDVGNGVTYMASVVGYDASQDVAVLQVAGVSGLKTVPLGTGRAAEAVVGEQVAALGNAGGMGGAPAEASGTVAGLNVSVAVADSGITEHLSGLISASLPLKLGDSGGPLIDSDGVVIGMDTALSSQHMTGSDPVRVTGFAIPIARALSICTAIVTGQASTTVHIGP